MNVNVDKELNKVTIKLNKSFYDIDSIKMGIEDFSGPCSAIVNEKERFEIVLKSKGNSDICVLGYEFCNYVLALMKNENIV